VRDVVRQEPASSYLWALLAEEALAPEHVPNQGFLRAVLR